MGTGSSSRILYLDSLRIFLIFMVICYHTAMIYGLPQSWFYHELANDMITRGVLSYFNCINQTYFMGLFFFISGYFTPLSYIKRGKINFLINKSWRIIPGIIIFSFIINPLLIYFGAGISTNIIIYFYDIFRGILHDYNYIHPGPLWYTQMLLVYYFGYAFVSDVMLIPPVKLNSNLTKIFVIFSLIILTTSTIIIRIWFPIGKIFLNFPIPYMPYYIIMFIVGIYAFHFGWINQIIKYNKIWYLLSILTVLIWPVITFPGLKNPAYTDYLRGGTHPEAYIYATWEIFTGICISLSLLSIFKKYAHYMHKITILYAKDIYNVLIIHTIIVTAYGLIFRNIQIYPMFKFALVSVLSTATSFFISKYIITKIFKSINLRI